MGRRRKTGFSGQKILGTIFALAGAFILIDIMPVYVWWFFLGIGLIIVGWLLYNF